MTAYERLVPAARLRRGGDGRVRPVLPPLRAASGPPRVDYLPADGDPVSAALRRGLFYVVINSQQETAVAAGVRAPRAGGSSRSGREWVLATDAHTGARAGGCDVLDVGRARARPARHVPGRDEHRVEAGALELEHLVAARRRRRRRSRACPPGTSGSSSSTDSSGSSSSSPTRRDEEDLRVELARAPPRARPRRGRPSTISSSLVAVLVVGRGSRSRRRRPASPRAEPEQRQRRRLADARRSAGRPPAPSRPAPRPPARTPRRRRGR